MLVVHRSNGTASVDTHIDDAIVDMDMNTDINDVDGGNSGQPRGAGHALPGADAWLTSEELELFADDFDVTTPEVAAALRKLLERELPNPDVRPAPSNSPLHHGARRPEVKWSTKDMIGRKMQAALRERMKRSEESWFKTPCAREFLDMSASLPSSVRTSLLHWVHRHGDEHLKSCLPKSKDLVRRPQKPRRQRSCGRSIASIGDPHRCPKTRLQKRVSKLDSETYT